MKERNYCLVWSQLEELVTPPIVTTDFIYFRLIGDRSIDERDFGKIKRDRTKDLQQWTKIFKDIQKNEKNVKTAIVAANNHYAGFAPLTAKLFLEMIRLENKIRPFPIVDYKIPMSTNSSIFQNDRIYKNYKTKTRQTDISEFFR